MPVSRGKKSSRQFLRKYSWTKSLLSLNCARHVSVLTCHMNFHPSRSNRLVACLSADARLLPSGLRPRISAVSSSGFAAPHQSARHSRSFVAQVSNLVFSYSCKRLSAHPLYFDTDTNARGMAYRPLERTSPFNLSSARTRTASLFPPAVCALCAATPGCTPASFRTGTPRVSAFRSALGAPLAIPSGLSFVAELTPSLIRPTLEIAP